MSNNSEESARIITCPVCPHACRLKEGEVGFCAARQAKGNEVISLGYSRITAYALDPIEKKPLHFFHPGKRIFSVGSFGCNMNCYFCQNFDIARVKDKLPQTSYISPIELVGLALSLKDEGNCGIAFTYNEPLIAYEYVRDTAELAREQGLETVVVTNGQINEKYLEELLPLITAWNIDLKAFSEAGYRKLGGDFNTTKTTIEKVAATAHLELTTLVVPGLSDNQEDMEAEASYIASVNKGIPLHLSRYFPAYRASEKATDLKQLKQLAQIAEKHLDHVILGNI